ncbi:hypothetical protein MTR67_000518 [Solanum verrucosum]|uniref:Translocation protein SEC62 n=1 Tax=Solanum verrucosum TaxID=315347 RepID=A0AAF0T7J1_SOLVR|nr:hypothetical protein MTR67_000518 [Solanum verrucosum]
MKKPGGAEKKKVRRSAGVASNGSNSTTSTIFYGADTKKIKTILYRKDEEFASEKQGVKDVFQLFAEKARDHKGLVSRWAVLQETRVEYFRGKDFVAFVRNHSELKDILESDKDLEPEDIANTLLQKNLLVRCDRVVKIVRPGKKKLSSWPAHLEIYHFVVLLTHVFYGPIISVASEYDIDVDPLYISKYSENFLKIVHAMWDQVFSENDAFFAWAFVKRRPLWQTLLSFFWPVLTLAICLFPVYPHWAKLLILYTCAGLLLLILSLLFIRALIFGAIWVLFGKRVWFFPNILAEEATLQDLFQVWPQKDEAERPKWTARLFYAIVAVVVILLLRHHAPDEAARARYQKRVSNIIDDVLEWSPRQALSGMMDTVVNVTDSNDNAADESKTGSEKVYFTDDLDEETDLKEESEDVIGNLEDSDHQQRDL